MTSQVPTARGHLPRLLRRKWIIAAGAIALLGVTVGTVAATTSSSAKSGVVRGIVVLGPMIPVDPGSPIVWIPQKTAVSVVRSGTTVLMATPSNATGRFTLHLAPGRYRLTAQPTGTTTVSRSVTLTVKDGGSYVVRLWLDNGVRFPAAATARPTTIPSEPRLGYAQGIVGLTTLGPLSGVSSPGRSNDRPYGAKLLIWHLDGAPAATVSSSASRGFVVALPVGRYIVEPLSTRPALYPRAAPFSVVVTRDSWQRVAIIYDTGIR
jgi:hypothetical protein